MIKIGIVDDHAVVRAGLREFFSQHVDLRVVGEACNGREAVELACTTDLHVLTMDLAMPGQSGVDALAMIRAKAPNIGILMLSGYPETQYAVSLIRQGAAGYLNKDCDPREIVNAIRTVALGGRYLTMGIADLLAKQLHRTVGATAHESLSEREFQVFLKLAKGETVKDISKALSLSGKTVSTYRARMMENGFDHQQRADLLRPKVPSHRMKMQAPPHSCDQSVVTMNIFIVVGVRGSDFRPSLPG